MTIRTLVLGAAAIALAGCSGNSAGFDDFFERQGSGTTEAYVALVRSATFDQDTFGEVDVNDDETTLVGDVEVELDAFGDVDSLDVDSTGASVDFDRDLGDVIDDDGEFINAEIDTASFAAVGRFGNPGALGLSYQSFGAWASVDDFGDGELGATVFGEVTPAGDVPTSGSASYAGRSTGIYVNETDDTFLLTQSDMTAEIDFGAGSIDFDTFNTESAEDFNDPFTAMGELDASGTLFVAGSTFDGGITTDSGLSGAADGVFAGPEAEELGGTLYAGDADEAYIAGFGGRR